MSLENKKHDLVYHEYKIDQQPWQEYQTDIEARAKVAYDSDRLFLEFTVVEPFVQAQYSNTNGEVHHDSCVEFFVRFNDDENYYNLEFNVLGNIQFAYGSGRNDRAKIRENIINEISRKLFFQPCNKNEQLFIEWRLAAEIPVSVFQYTHREEFRNHRIFGNFYKCGDGYDKPHYLSWSNIKSPYPDFHRPEYFRLLLFNKESQ